MTRKEQIEREAQSYWDCNPKYAFKEGVKWALTHLIGDLDKDFVQDEEKVKENNNGF